MWWRVVVLLHLPLRWDTESVVYYVSERLDEVAFDLGAERLSVAEEANCSAVELLLEVLLPGLPPLQNSQASTVGQDDPAGEALEAIAFATM